MPGISLIISFYNKLNQLKLVLKSLELQTFSDFEIVLADDGSSPEIVESLNELIKGSPLRIKHVWHEDQGWRKNTILNRAVTESGSEYLFFMDGDCLLHPRCLEEHFNHRSQGTIIAGRRVNLSNKMSDGITESNLHRLWGSKIPAIFWSGLTNSDVHSENAIYIRSSVIRSRLNKKDKGVLGSHFSIFKKDLLEVNGFDERFLLPAAGEDTDLELRLRRNGMRVKSLKHIALQYHLWHKELPREEGRLKILDENNKGGVTYTPYGIVKSGKI